MTLNILSGYQFIALNNLPELKAFFSAKCNALHLKGTILLSIEGININLCGEDEHIAAFQALLREDNRFAHITFRESKAENVAFRRLKIKIKNEIITFRDETILPQEKKAPAVSPELLKTWLDENRDFILLDTRNDYEVAEGTFTKAKDLNIQHFTEFSTALNNCDDMNKNKTIVMFCTGGIRCEKAALYMQQAGFNQVYQLEGGILNYFAKVGSAHYQGKCFVFDDRGVVDPSPP